MNSNNSNNNNVPSASSQLQSNRLLRQFIFILSVALIPLISIVLVSPSSKKYITFFLHGAAKVTSFITIHSAAEFPAPPFTLYSPHVVLPNESHAIPAYLSIDQSGQLAAISFSIFQIPSSYRSNVVDVTPLVVMPGLIDPHCHINSPGRDNWEGFNSAMRAAAVGGTTTVLDMPINSMPATVDLISLRQKVTSLRKSAAIINVGLIGGVVPENVGNLTDLLEAGFLALKSFLVDTQSPDFKMISVNNLRTAIHFLDEWQDKNPFDRRIPYIIHAEIDDGNPTTGSRANSKSSFNHSDYNVYEATRPSSWETAAVAQVLDAANGSQIHIHIAHVSTVEVTDQIRTSRKQGFNKAMITAETCPQYLLFFKEEILNGSTLFKCAPPIRSKANQIRMQQETFFSETSNRVIEIVASDHSPSTEELKDTDGNITAAWGGIAGLQYRLQATMTAAKIASSGKGVSISQISRLLSEVPAQLFGLSDRKGSFEVGKDADIVIFDPNVDILIKPSDCEHRVKKSAYDNRVLRGKVWDTLIRGRVVFHLDKNGTRHFYEGHGRYIKRGKRGRIAQETIKAN